MPGPLYYNPQYGVNTSNVCGYGNHLACTQGKEGCECFCGHPQDEIPVEPEPEETTSTYA